jgi:release factor glutamine methyltransferase
MSGRALDREEVVRRLQLAGCIAAADEADELWRATAADRGRLPGLVERREAGEPLAWLTGSVRFGGLDLVVEPGVYVPRWQSEPLARRAAAALPAGGVAVDLCTGCGAIAAVLAAAVPSARVLATEIDPIARRCARRNGGDRVEVFGGSLDEALPAALAGAVDVIVSVVPYVPTEALHLLPRDVQAFEPRLALDGGTGGTTLLDEVVARSPRWLRPGGWLFLELGGDQVELITRRLREHGFEPPEVRRDEEGDPRAIGARLTP